MDQTATKVITAHVPVALAQKVDLWSQRLERPWGWIMKQALAAWVEQEEQKNRLTLEALQDVEEGRVVNHEDVLAWAESLGSSTPLPVPGTRT